MRKLGLRLLEHGSSNPKSSITLECASHACAVRELMNDQSRPWHHRPAHVFAPNTMYVVTGSTLHKQHYFRGHERLALLQDALFEVTTACGWELQAWAIFANHYHFIAQSPAVGTTLKSMIQRLHSQTARAVNQLDATPGRQVWFQYWDTCLTYEKSYYARLNYVHNNPVKHGLVATADQYSFCSAAWFQEQADERFRKKVASFRYDHVKIADDFPME